MGPVRGGRNGTVLARVVGVCSVWVVLLCLCCMPDDRTVSLPCEAWDGGMHTARDVVALTVRSTTGAVPSVTHTLSPPPLLSHCSAPVCASLGAPTGCLVHVSGLVEPAPLRVVDAPNLPASEVDSTRPLFLPWYRGADRCVSAPQAVCSPVSLSACHGAGGGAPGRCVSPEPVLSPPSR